jgi:hypothetical protein
MALIKPGADARHLRLVTSQSMACSSASSLVACYIALMPLRTTFSRGQPMNGLSAAPQFIIPINLSAGRSSR